jgi:cellobiose phosphorylase
MLFKPERYEKFPLFFVSFKEKGKGIFSNFFKPHSGDIFATPEDYECTFKPEYAEYKITFNGWRVVTRLSIASDSPSVIMKVSVENCENSPRQLNINPVWRPHNTKADLALWDVPELYQSCKFFNNHGTGIMIETRDPDAQASNRKYTAMLTDLPIAGAELSYEKYLGKGNFENPEAFRRNEWSIKNDSTFELENFRGKDAVISQLPIAAMQSRNLAFKPGEKFEFSVALSHFKQSDLKQLPAAADKCKELLSAQTWTKTIEAHQRLYTDWMNQFRAETPDPALNRYINEWLIMQLFWVSKLDRGWPTGMRGTRDAAQDYSGLSYLNPGLGKDMLLEMFACQRSDGSFPRQFSCLGPEGKHDLRDYVDSGCWVFELFYDYMCLSGDKDFLNLEISWLDSKNPDSVEEHAKQILEYYLNEDNYGEHGLVKIKGGDWNDSINNAGLSGIGESVMVSCQVVHLLQMAQDVFSEDQNICNFYAEKAAGLKENIRKHALNKSGFLNGVFTDNREWIFSDSDADGEERMNSPVNSFGVIADIFEDNELPLLFEKFEALKGPNGYRLFYPPLGRQTIPLAGRMGSGDLYPGNAENGTVYNHGSQGFLMRALTSAGDGNRALNVLRHIFSYDQSIHPVEVCKTEPYGILNCWNEVQGREGEGEKVFLSGTISTVFRAFYGGLLGFKPQLDGFKLEPSLPDCWNNVSYSCKFRSFNIKIDISRNAGQSSRILTLNGQKLSDPLITADMLISGVDNEIKLKV